VEWVLARRDVRLGSLFFAEGTSLDDGSPVEKGLRWKGDRYGESNLQPFGARHRQRAGGS
jgi:hypothetical protein